MDVGGGPGVGGLVAWSFAKASESFLLAVESAVFVAVSARFAEVSCWRTVVSLAAARARLSSAVPKRSMVAGGAGRTAFAPPRGSPPPDACSWRWRRMWAAVDGRAAFPLPNFLWEVLCR